MKTIMKTIKLFMYAILVLGFLSCTGEDGEDGLDGAQGEQGIEGEDGNANVIASDWITPEFDPAISVSALATIDAPEITEEVLSSSAILVYTQSFAGQIIALPINNDFFEFSYISNINSPNLLTINATSVSGSDTTWSSLIVGTRYVIIPPTNNSGRSLSSPESILNNLREEGVDITNYDEVATYFNL